MKITFKNGRVFIDDKLIGEITEKLSEETFTFEDGKKDTLTVVLPPHEDRELTFIVKTETT
jgi:hypothetical protein